MFLALKVDRILGMPEQGRSYTGDTRKEVGLYQGYQKKGGAILRIPEKGVELDQE